MLKTKEFKKLVQVRDLALECNDLLVDKFLDLDSTKMLDKKIKVLTDLKNGKVPAEIDGYYDILEKYPKDENELWDL